MRRDRIALLLIALSLLAACGQKGDLVRPEPKPAESAAK